MSALQPGSVIGILGGGQLGRMLAGAAARLGFDVHILCPEADPPAARAAAKHVRADYEDEAALKTFADACDVVTYEFENVPVASIEMLLAHGALVRPGARSLGEAQDRLEEKRFLRSLGIETAPFEPVDSPGMLRTALVELGGEGLLKTRRDGYDGKGQKRVNLDDDLDAAFAAIGGVPAILEGMVDFRCEISAVVARGADGETRCFEPSENDHEGGVLRSAHVPARVSDETRSAACRGGEALAAALDHVGVLALEYFVLEDGRLLANEYAPRVHNSGHWTPEACQTGQFEQHIRAVAGWPLGPETRLFDARMNNILGEEALADPASYGPETVLTLYGKRDAKPGRKMGHKVVRLGPASR